MHEPQQKRTDGRSDYDERNSGTGSEVAAALFVMSHQIHRMQRTPLGMPLRESRWSNGVIRRTRSPVSGLNGRPLAYKASALPLS